MFLISIKLFFLLLRNNLNFTNIKNQEKEKFPLAEYVLRTNHYINYFIIVIVIMLLLLSISNQKESSILFYYI